MDAGTGSLLRVEVLGGVRAWLNDREIALGPPRQRALFATLAIRANQTVTRDELIDAVWGDQAPTTAVNGVHTYVAGLRQVLEPSRTHRAAGGVLTGNRSGYTLRLLPGQLDLALFGERQERARQLLAAGDHLGAVDAFSAALALWRGTPLAGAPGPFAEAERLRVGELRIATIEERAEAMLSLGQHAKLVGELSREVAEHPFRETLRRLLMNALYRCGRQAEALAVFADTRRLLVDELGIEPGPQLQRLHYEILNSTLINGGQVEDGYPAKRPAERVVPRQLPPALRHFAARSAELQVLTGLIDNSAGQSPAAGTTLITAIDGTAGIGKTALAVHWAQRVADRFPDGQLYVNLRGFDPTGTPMTPAEVVRGFLDALNVTPERVPASLDAQVALYRSLVAGKSMLVVLDNARDAEQVRPLLPGAPGCVAVVTSRNQLTPLVASEGAHPVNLDLLTVDEAHDLLTRRLGKDRVTAEPQAVDAIITRCARLPLPLAIVAARAATHPDTPLAALANQLADVHDTHTGLDTLSAGDTITDVRAVFSWSYHTLAPQAARLFRLLGLHAGPDISTPAAASLAGLPPQQVRPLLAELARAHLIVEHTPGRYTFHDLLRAYATHLAHSSDPGDQRHAAVHRILDHYLHTAYTADRLLNPTRDPIILAAPQPGVTPEHPADHERALAWFTAEHSVLLTAIDHAAGSGFDTHIWQLAWSLATFLHWRGHWHDQVATGHAVLAAARRLADPAVQAYAHRLLARGCLRLGRDADAHTHLRHALDLYRQTGDRAGQAYTHRYLSVMWERQDRHAEALDHAQQALDLFRTADHRAGQADSLNAVGWEHAQLGNHQQALTYCQQALTLLQELGDHAGQAATWDSLGYIHHLLGHHPEAATCYQHAHTLYRDVGDRYEEAATLTNLGDTHHAAGNLHAARDAWQRALTILDNLDHPDADQVRAKLHHLDHPDAETNG
jgi:DNA-binding SARP family transcriptional activator